MGFWIPFLIAASLFSGAASYVAAKKAQKAAKRPNDDQRGVLVNKESNIEQIPVIYGERRVGGVRVFVSTDGTTSTGAYTWKSGYDADTEAYAEFENSPTNEYLYVALVLAEGEVESITELLIDDVPVTDAKFSGLIDYDVYLGSDAQTMPTTALLRGVNEFWTADHRLRGVAFLGLRFKWDEEAFAGVPDVTALVKGKKLYDPRTATTAWSDNPALCIRDYLTNARYGKGLSTSAVDDTAIGVAATACDESVTEYSGGATGKLFTCNTVLDTSKTLFDNLNILLLGCRGFLPYSQGEYRLKIDGSSSSQFAFTTDHIIGGISIQGESKSDKYNRVTVKFPNPDANWQPDTAIWPAAGSTEETAYLAADGGILLQEEIELDTITSYYQARDLARILLLRSRSGITCAIKVTSEALQLEIADVITVTHPTPGWNAKPFQIMGMQLNDDGTVDIALLEYDSTIYTWEVGTVQQTYPDTSLADPFTVGAVSNIVITETTTLGVDGTVIPSGLITWTRPYDKLVNSFEIQYKLASQADSFYESIITGLARYEFFNAPVGVSVTIRIRSINSIGSKSAWTTTTYTITGDVAAPDAPTGLTVTQGMLNIRLDWVNPTATDYKSTDVYRYTSNSSGSAVKIASITGESFVDQNIAAATTYYYWTKAVDYSGNYSGFSGVASTNATDVTAVVADGSITVAKFASSIEPVTLVTSVPSTKSTEVIYNTTNNTLYRWDGSAYVAATGVTDFSQLSGNVTAAQFAATIEPVSLVTSVPSSKTTEVIYNTTNNKLYRWDGSAYAEATGVTNFSQLSGNVTAAQFAATIQPVTLVTSVPSTKSTETIYNTTNNTLYRWDGSAYVTVQGATDFSQLTGTVQTAQIAAAAITASKIGAAAVTATALASGSVSAATIAAGAVTAGKIAAGAISATEIAAGAVTTAKLDALAITADKIASNAITTSKISAGAVTAASISAGTITAAEIATNTITAGQIAAGAIATTELAVGAVGTINLADDAITAAKILDGSITATLIGDGQIVTSKLGANAVTAAKITAGTITATQIATGTITATQIASNTITAGQIAAGAISTSELAVGAVGSTNIANDAVTAAKILDGSITATLIGDGQIVTSKLNANAVTAAKIAAGTITATQIATGTITATQIASNTITAGQIAAGAITATEIAADAISVAKLISNTSKTYGNFKFEMGTNTTVAGFQGAGIFRTGQSYGFGLGGLANAATSVAIMGQQAHNSTDAYGAYFANSTALGGSTHRSQAGLCNNARAAIFANNTSPVNYTSLCNAAYAVQTTGDLYVDGDITATGTITPFTGMHDGLLDDAVFPDIGDILIDSQLLIKRNVANTLFLMDISSVPNTSAIGIYAGTRSSSYVPVAAQLAYVDKGFNEENLPALDPIYAPDFVDRKTIISNSLGEGLVNVCNEGGNIAAGDLIVTSSVSGKGMKQADDILRSYTVAKAREAATFSGSEIKQIACIYLCG
jgi:predicted phage tail protein